MSPTLFAAESLSQTISSGARLFQKACIGCHDMGGNILQPDATLFMKTTEERSIYGGGNIQHHGFGEKCTPRGQCTFGPRLQEEEIKLLAEFVKSQADRGWPNIESHRD
ncbi:Cytochrome c6, chloroplastic [Ananas comosus]|uniref:Cytochrome c-553 n=1 Tax=Ananas comosus TaxID=4615 RepID=A0A199V7X8_ANACO|nr:Cytochrome c6, chloroplastic [Ananas comosus]